MPIDTKVPHADLTYRIIGAAMRVHNRFGPGLKEQHYQRALSEEMRADGLGVADEHCLEIHDGETWLGRLYSDHWVEDKVVVETEAFPHLLTDAEVAQVVGCVISSANPLSYPLIVPPRYEMIVAVKLMDSASAPHTFIR